MLLGSSCILTLILLRPPDLGSSFCPPLAITYYFSLPQSRLFQEFSRMKPKFPDIFWASAIVSLSSDPHLPLNYKSYRLTVVWLFSQPHHKAHVGTNAGATLSVLSICSGQKELTLLESKLGPIDHSERVSPSIEGSVSRLAGLENELIPTPNVALSSQ